MERRGAPTPYCQSWKISMALWKCQNHTGMKLVQTFPLHTLMLELTPIRWSLDGFLSTVLLLFHLTTLPLDLSRRPTNQHLWSHWQITYLPCLLQRVNFHHVTTTPLILTNTKLCPDHSLALIPLWCNRNNRHRIIAIIAITSQLQSSKTTTSVPIIVLLHHLFLPSPNTVLKTWVPPPYYRVHTMSDQVALPHLSLCILGHFPN